MKKNIKIAFFAILCSFAMACQKDDSFPDTTTFELVTMGTFLQDIEPANAVDYLELRRSSGTGADGSEVYGVIDSAGIKCDNDSMCFVNLANLPVQLNGFNKGCLPGYCFHYLISTSGPSVMVWDSPDKLKQLFGEINTKSEASLLVFANGYWFNSSDRKISGTRESTDGSFQVVCTRITSYCTPVITQLYVLEVSKSGEVRILAEKEYSRSNVCI